MHVAHDNFEKNTGYRRILVVGVHGADVVGGLHMQTRFASWNMALACVERPGYTLPVENLGKNLFVVRLTPEFLAESTGDMSSTFVQKLMRGEVRVCV